MKVLSMLPKATRIICHTLFVSVFFFIATVRAIDEPSKARKEVTSDFDQRVMTMLQARCYACHDQQTAEGKLDLKALPKDLDNAATFAMWVKVHDRVRDGEMPPKDETRLTSVEKSDFLSALDERLYAADSARQLSEGRALARRLNRDEYQNTLRDLLGVVNDYRELLPADGSALGFDKVGTALNISPEHLESYLAAADAALAEAIVSGPLPVESKKRIPQRYNRYFTQKNYEFSWGHLFLDLPDAFVRYTPFNDSVSGFRAESPGMYRLRIRARAYDSVEPIRTRIRAGYPGENASGERWLVGYEDFPREGKVFETIQHLNQRDTIRISPKVLRDSGSTCER